MWKDIKEDLSTNFIVIFVNGKRGMTWRKRE